LSPATPQGTSNGTANGTTTPASGVRGKLKSCSASFCSKSARKVSQIGLLHFKIKELVFAYFHCMRLNENGVAMVRQSYMHNNNLHCIVLEFLCG